MLGLSWMHLVKRRVYVVIDHAMLELDLAEWYALCQEAPTEVKKLVADYLAPKRVPFEWYCHFDLFSVEIGETVTGRWTPVGPEDTLLKRLPTDTPVDWTKELREAEGWLLANRAAKPILDGFLYLARRVGGVGPVKLGFSREPEKRAQRLPSKYGLSGRYEVIARTRGEPEEERSLHAALRHLRDQTVLGSGEWYRPVETVLSCFERLLLQLRAKPPKREGREKLYSVAKFVAGLNGKGVPRRRMTVR